MKSKRLLLALILCLLTVGCVLALSACGEVAFEVHFMVDGEQYATVTTAGEETISMPENPTKEGYTFEGWYWDEGTWQKPFTVNSLLDAPLSGDMQVYAHFIEEGAEEGGNTEGGSTEGGTTEGGNTEGGTTEGGSNEGGNTGGGSTEGGNTEGGSTTADLLAYQINGDGATCTVTGMGNFTGTDLVIPSTYRGLPVTRIASSAFYGCTNLTSITIPSSVTSISGAAFEGCTGLASVTFEGDSQLTSIGYEAFRGCMSLASITIPSSVTSIDSYAFYCTSLKSITIPEGVTSIGAGAFFGCSSLVEMTIPFVGGEAGKTSSDTYQYPFGYIFGTDSYTGGTAVQQYYYGSSTSDTTHATYYIPASLRRVTVTGGNILYGVFQNCSMLTEVTLPNSVTSIGSSAFSGCTGLASITVPSGVTSIGSSAFYYCTSLKSITIPSSVTSIGWAAFWGCSSLVEMTIPFVGGEAGKTSSDTYQYPFGYIFGTSSYTGGTAVKQYYYGSSTSSTTNSTYYIPATLRRVTVTGGNILRGAFDDCSMLTEVTIGSSVTSIGKCAFYGCTGLTSITIPSSVTSIGEYAFRGCSSLVEMTIPFVGGEAGKTSSDTYQYPFGYIFGTSSYTGSTEVTQSYYGSSTSSTTNSTYYIPATLRRVTVTGGNILYGAFYGCSMLTGVTIGSSVTRISGAAFDGCTSLASVTFEEGSQLTSIGSFYGCTSLASITIPEGVTSIGYEAFYGCTSLASVTFEGDSQLTRIGSYAFSNCWHLTRITIPEGVTSIDYCAFENTPLTNITIPSSVTSIGRWAFHDCETLTSITIPSSVTSIGDDAFYGCTGLTAVHISDLSAWCGISFYDAQANPLYYAGKLYLGGTLVTKLVIPEGVTSIGDYAFCGCTGLKSVTIADDSQLTSIGYSAFYGCTGLTAVHISDIGAWCEIEFGDLFANPFSYANPLYYAKHLYLNGTEVKNLVIPDGVTSIGDYAFCGCTGLKSVTIADDSQLTSIGFGAFSGCTGLTSITIPSSVTSIGSYAFSGCSSLVEMTIPFVGGEAGKTSSDTYQYPFGYIFGTSSYTGGTAVKQYYYGSSTSSTTSSTYYIPATLRRVTVTGGNILYGAFRGCSMLTGVTIGNGVTRIDVAAFSGCTGLTSITIPSSVTSIGGSAFYGCTGLKSITIPSSVTSIGNSAFSGCSGLTSIKIPSSVTSIGGSAFEGCTSLTAVHISDRAAWCGISFGNAYANPLYYAGKLYLGGTLVTKLVIPNSVTSIGSYAFYRCTSLTSITIPSSVTSIGASAFNGCTGLTSVTIGNGVTEIGSYAFSGCTSLASITIPSSVTSIGSYAFRGCTSLTYTTYGNANYLGNSDNPYVALISSASTSITSCTVHENTKAIAGGAFYECKNLTTVTFEGDSKLTSIGSYAFYYCTGLTSITIPSSVTSIGSSAFYYCTGLTSITIPSSVTSISGAAFYGCTSLTSVTFEGDSQLTIIGEDAFYGCKGLTSITIPSSVTSIGSEAFYNCTGLTAVHISDHAAWCGISFYDAYANPLYYAGKLYLGGTLVTKLVIPNSVTSIGSYAFYRCTSLTSITIPSSVTSIGAGAFSGCSSLVEMTIPFVGGEAGKTSSDTYQYPFGYIFGTSSYTGGTKVTQSYYGSSTSSTTNSTYYIPASLRRVTVTGGNLLYGAFYNCSMLTEVTIGNGVTSIGKDAFYGCTSLASVTFADDSQLTSIGDYAFRYCTGLTSITIPDSVTSIGSSAFRDCTGLTSIAIPDSVTSIGGSAFYNCTGLTSITIPSSVTSIGNSAFSGCTSLAYTTYGNAIYLGNSENPYLALIEATSTSVTSCTIHENTKVIAGGAFLGCTGLTAVHISDLGAWCRISFGSSSANPLYYAGNLYLGDALVTKLVIPEGVTSIGDYAFCGCTGLTSITIPSSVTSIGDYAFNGCKSLTSVTFEGDSQLTSIGSSAFYNCKNLTSITIPSSVTSIGSSAFSSCMGLTNITVAQGNTKYHSSGNCLIETATKTLILGCQNSVIPTDGSVTSIGSYAFYCCTGLTSIKIPEGVTSIGYYAFYGCTGLTSIKIPSSVTSIGSYAFLGCCKLVEVYDLSEHLTVTAGSKDNGYVGYYAKVVHTSAAEESCLHTTQDGYVFFENGDEVYLVGYVGTDTALTLPDKYNGKAYGVYQYAFDECKDLTSITIPNSVTSIGYSAFYGCTGLKSVTFEGDSQLTSIGEYAFRGCTGLTSITIPNSVTSIGSDAFYGCTGLTSITVAQGNTKYHSAGNCLIETATKTLILGCKNSVIPTDGSVTSIGKYAFRGCTGLTSITIPSSVTSIDSFAFYGCTGLTSITIPSSVTSIGDYAFDYCTGLTNVYITTTGWFVTYSSTATSGTSVTLTNSATAATYLTDTYDNYYFKR